MKNAMDDDGTINAYGGPLAAHSEYRRGEHAPFVFAGQVRWCEVLHVSDGPGGQLYTVVNECTGFPDVLLASALAPPRD